MRFYSQFLLLVFAISPALWGQTRPEFLDAQTYASSPSPAAIAIGDFNGDGKLDIVEAGQGVSTILGNGDGTFSTGKNSPMTRNPNSIAVGDFDHDGKLDLVMADFLDYVSVMLGNGDGSFQAFVNYPAGKKPNSVTVADFNGDGNLDVASTDGVVVDVLFGKGDGTFQPLIAVNGGSNPSSVTSMDLNGDSKADLIIVCNIDNFGGGTVNVMLGNGNGTFQSAVAYSPGSFPSRVAIADFNGDQRPDLAVSNNGDGTVSILLGNGDGTFQPQTAVTTQAGPFQIVTGDFNGDRKIDIATLNYLPFVDHSVAVLLGKGDGTFRAPAENGVGVTDFGFPGLVVGAFNQDGTDDLAVNANSFYDKVYSINVLLANGNGGLRSRRVYATSSNDYSNTYAQSVADLNRDGKLDIVMATWDSSVCSVFSGNGDGTFQSRKDFATDLFPARLALGDLNNDGKIDAVTANYRDSNGGGNGSISVLLGNGDGNLGTHHDFALSTGVGIGLALGDFNGDGFLDAIMSTLSGSTRTVVLAAGDGRGGFTPLITIATSTTEAWGDIAVGDVNGDGKTDFLALSDAIVSVFLGNGDGTFHPAVDYAVAQFRYALKLIDVNHDGNLDVVTAGARVLSVLLGNGNGTFQTNLNSPVSDPAGYPTSVAVADFNGDGKLDVATANGTGYYQGEFVSVFRGNGDGTFQPNVNYVAGFQPFGVVAADLNSDGAPDLAAATGLLNVLMNAGGTKITIQSSNNPSHAGDAVTFTAAVSATFQGTGSPTGRVRFEDGKTILGTIALSSGQAQFTTSPLAVGNHRMDAVYEGNLNFNPHKSSVLVQQVLP
jgi:hypothetical protein